MPLPLSIIIDRIEGGRLRAELSGASIEAGTVDELLGAIGQKVAVALIESPDESDIVEDDEQERLALQEIEKHALSKAELDALIARNPVPREWYDEPDWLDDPE